MNSKANGSWTWGICAALVIAALPVSAETSLPGIFSDNMVLQRDQPVPIWGWAKPGETVRVSFAGRSKSATASASGDWQLRLDAMAANKIGQDLVVNAGSTITFKNVLVGEVWICSGQSNMEMGLGNSLNGQAEVAAMGGALIRRIKIPHVTSPFPVRDVSASWQVASAQTSGEWTAAGVFFARELVKELDVPVGLIDSNWSGTSIEPWICREGFASVPEFKEQAKIIDATYPDTEPGQKRFQGFLVQMKDWLPQAEKAVTAKRPPPPLPAQPGLASDSGQMTCIFNGNIAPLIPYAFHGVIWYQGESNGGDGDIYARKIQALIGGWRQLWKQGEFPFYYVQIANFNQPNAGNPEMGDGWARVREAQRKALAIPHTGMAVIIDIGEADNIHPRNKQDVGKRLAAWALAKDFGRKVEYSGPLFAKSAVEGNHMRISFDHAGSGLMVGEKAGLDPVKPVSGGKVNWISIAGDDKKFYWGDAVIDGQTLVVSSDKVAKPVAVRYAFAMNPAGANLYNKDGFPTSPFRTDDW